MRKHLKRTLAALLAVVMILAMLPAAVLAADEAYPVTALKELPGADQTVVIYSQSAGGFFGDVAGGSIAPVAAKTTEESPDLQAQTGTNAYKLTANSDGTYYLMTGGKYLCVDSSEKITLQDSAISGTKWKIKAAEGFDGYTLVSNDSKYNGREIYLECYGGSIKAWTCSKLDQIFVFQFYAIDGAAADADGDGYIGGTRPKAGALPKDGSTVVIYNAYGGACIGAPAEGDPSVTLQGPASTADEPGNGALIFKVHYDGSKYYTFENQGKYLCTSDTEELVFSDTETEYTKWRLEECAGGYIIYNKTAKWNGNYEICIEYYNDGFAGYSFYSDRASIYAMNFYEVEDTLGLGYVLNPKMSIKAENAFIGKDYSFEVTLDELTKVTEMTMTYALDGGAATKLEPTAVDGYKYSYTIPTAALAGKSALTIKGVAKNEYNLEYNAETTVEIKDEPIIKAVSPMPNDATGSEKRPEISATIANCGANPTVTMTVDGTAVKPTVTADKISYKPAANMTDDRHNVTLVITREDGKKAEMTWSFFVGEAGLSLYFGQMHSHTAEYSDGAGQLEDAYEYAMNKAQDVDFLFVTDHSNYFDTTATATKTSYYDLSSLTKVGDITKWEQAKKTAEEYNAMSTDFIAAYGYEMTWSGGPGHTNTFNTYGIVSRNNSELNNKTGYAGMHLYNDLMANANKGLDVDGNPVGEGVKTKWIEEAPVVSQFNHPGKTFGTFDDFAGYTPTRDAILNLVEVGNGEGKVGGSSYFPSYSEYDKALSKGWHVAPTNNQDNHKGRWGDANTCRDVVLTDDFTETGLYEAMAARRVYATEDQNLRIYYYLNGELMGSIIDVGEERPAEVTLTASISDPDGEALGKVEIIGENGITLASFDAPGSTYELNATIKNTDAYYYLRITQADGDKAVTAPVWVGVATPITADIDTDAALSVVGQSEKITVAVDNAADADYTLSKVELSLIAGGKESVVKTIDDTSVVKPGESKSFDIEYIRTVAGEQQLKVVFYGTYNGKTFKCQATMDQKVYKAEDLVKVAVDFGHGNFYVSGGYSDNMGNFVQYCAENGASVSFIQKGEFTYKNLKQYKLVILTVPFDTGTLQPSAYTADELAALKTYAERGGNIIITSKSDRKSPTGELNCANLSNTLLETIGSNVRVANGIIVDNDMKANEAYRIYFSSKSNINTEHRFTKGTYTASNAFGTTSAPDNSTGFQLYNAAPILINEGAEDKVTTLVQGYQSTWGASYTDNFTGSAYEPNYSADTVTAEMGEVNIMTYEELSGGGWLITSGCTFFSNYDIKDDQNYVNKFITQNILRDLTGVDENLKITPIKTVKGVPEDRSGEEYTIEGYVTSNASAYDQDTAFFDCIYMQDKNGNGINVFPVAGNYAIGMNVRAHGGVTYYCGEIELNLGTDYDGYIRVISDNLYTVRPAEVDCKTAMKDSSIGNLMKVKGIVTEIHKTEGVIDKIYVRDAAGEACLFINGYIMKNYKGLDDLKVGMIISGVGIGSRDVDETSATSAIFSRLRVRDRREIKILDSNVNVDLLFNDVNEKNWFYDEVQYAVEHELFMGTSHSTFEPESTLTRAMAATVLYRLDGKPTVGDKVTFKDVKEGTWYTEAVTWAQSAGVVKGYEDNTFRPNQKITREEMAVMLARYAAYKKVDVTANGDLKAYPDAGSVAAWAKDAVTWCVDNGIINGSDGKLLPKGNATRAQFTAIIVRFDKLQSAE